LRAKSHVPGFVQPMTRPVVVLGMDGVLLDTVPVLYDVFRRFLSERGAVVTPALFASYRGTTVESFIADLKQRFAWPMPEATLANEYRRALSKVYDTADLTTGCRDFLSYSRDLGVTLCLATGSDWANVDRVLENHDLGNIFEVVVTANDFTRGEPHPQTFRKIKSKLGEADYLVVDDSSLGLESAVKAGMTALHFMPIDTARSSYVAINGFDDLMHFLTMGHLKGFDFVPCGNLSVAQDPDKDLRLQEKPVEEYWNELLRNEPAVFNGGISLIGKVEAHPADSLAIEYLVSDYKSYRFLKDRRRLPVVSLAVSGIVICGGDVLIGKRAGDVGQYPGYLEFPPSGNLEPACSPEEQVLRELREETKIAPEGVEELRLTGWGVDANCGSLDLIYRIEISQPPAEVECQEYEWITLKSVGEARELFKEHQSVPTSGVILRHILTEGAPETRRNVVPSYRA